MVGKPETQNAPKKRGPKPKPKTLPHDWEGSEVVTSWLGRIQRKYHYARELSYFTDWIGLTPEEILRKRKETLEDEQTERWLEDKVIEYADYLYQERALKENTVKSYLRSVQSFVLHHFRRRPLKFLRNEIRHQELQSVKDTYRPKWVLTNEELRVLFQTCRNNFDKGLLLALAHSGMSPVDVSVLKITDRLLEDIEKNRHHYIEKKREKSEELQQTFLSDECLFYTNLYLKRRKAWEIGDNVYVTQKGRNVDTDYILERFTHLVEIAFGKEKTGDFKGKNFRDILFNATQLVELTPELTESLMGWQKSGAKGRYKLNEQVIRVAFEKCFKYLSINGHNINRNRYEELEKGQDEQSNQIKAMSTTINILQENYHRLENELKDVREQNLADLTEMFGGEEGVKAYFTELLKTFGIEIPEGEGDFIIKITKHEDDPNGV